MSQFAGCAPISLVAALLVISACGGDDESDARATFTSPVYGYSIEHPEAWDTVAAGTALAEGEQPATSTGATDILGRGADVLVGNMDPPAVIIAAQPVADATTVDEWSASIVDTVAAMKGCDPPDARDPVEIDGEAGVLLTFRGCPPDLGLLHLWAGVVHDGRAFHIVWFNDPGDEAADRAEFERLLASMSFTADW